MGSACPRFRGFCEASEPFSALFPGFGVPNVIRLQMDATIARIPPRRGRSEQDAQD
jgi:hypothetical protein